MQSRDSFKVRSCWRRSYPVKFWMYPRVHSLSGQPVSVFDHPDGNTFLLISKQNSPSSNCCPLLLSLHTSKERLPPSFPLPFLKVDVDSNEISPQPSIRASEQTSSLTLSVCCSRPILVGSSGPAPACPEWTSEEPLCKTDSSGFPSARQLLLWNTQLSIYSSKHLFYVK